MKGKENNNKEVNSMTEAFLAEAMDRYGDAVYRLALCRLQSIADAEDVYQDTFLRFYQQKDAGTWGEEQRKAWLLRVAMNRCADLGRSRKVHGYVDLDAIPELAAQNTEGTREIWDAVNRLPEKQRTVFHLFYGEGYQTEEIAQILKVSGSAVRVNLNRARNSLRKELRIHV